VSIGSALIALVVVCTTPPTAQSEPQRQTREGNPHQELSGAVQELLSYLPIDMQTLMVSQERFQIERLDGPDRVLSAEESLRIVMLGLPEELLDSDAGILLMRFPVTIAVHGATRFRSPKGLGGAPYVGATIVQIEDPIEFSQRALSAADLAAPAEAEWTQIRSHETMTLRVKSNVGDDWWTYFIAQPKPKVLVCATNRRCFEEVLDRMAHPQKNRALPAQLAEWRFVNTQDPIWGIRHYDRRDAGVDPTFPDARDQFGGFTVDTGAVGCGFSYVPGQKVFKLAYISRTRKAAPFAREVFGLHETDGPVSQASFNGLSVVRLLAHFRPSPKEGDPGGAVIVLGILQALGHAIYI